MSTIQSFITDVLKHAGEIVLTGFYKEKNVTIKENQSSVLTQTDLASEKFIVAQIQKQFPQDSIIAEETGFIDTKSSSVWIVDPIDGTSNFAAGIPWFGVMLTKVENWKPVATGIYLPVSDEFYYSDIKSGALLNGKKIRVSPEKNLANLLVNYQIDVNDSEKILDREMRIIKLLVQNGRNLRTTNSCIDFCHLATGKYGVNICQSECIWDVAAQYMLITGAGGRYTDVLGNEINFVSDVNNYKRNFTSLSAAPEIHAWLLPKIREILE